MQKIEAIRQSASIVPILNVNDIVQSLAYYKKTLHFNISWQWGNPVSFAGISMGEAEIFLCENGQGHAGTWLSLFIDGVDDYHQIILQSGADIVSEPRDEPWGVRELHVRDPDGHILRIGTSLDILSNSD